MEQSIEHRDKRGNLVIIRPICSHDVAPLSEFHNELSEETVENRWFYNYSFGLRTDPKRLLHQCTNTQQGFALVALVEGKLSGIGRAFFSEPQGCIAHVAFTIRDIDQSFGIGTILLSELTSIIIERKRNEKKRRITIIAEVLRTNKKMVGLFQKQGFTLLCRGYDDTLHVEKSLSI